MTSSRHPSSTGPYIAGFEDLVGCRCGALGPHGAYPMRCGGCLRARLHVSNRREGMDWAGAVDLDRHLWLPTGFGSWAFWSIVIEHQLTGTRRLDSPFRRIMRSTVVMESAWWCSCVQQVEHSSRTSWTLRWHHQSHPSSPTDVCLGVVVRRP